METPPAFGCARLMARIAADLGLGCGHPPAGGALCVAPATSSGKQTKKRPPPAARLAHGGPRWFIYPTWLCSHLIRSLGEFFWL